MSKKKRSGRSIYWYEEQNGILYRKFKSPMVNYGKEMKQLVLPSQLRKYVMSIAHESILAGHMGIRKTLNRILGYFYWPGINGDVQRYCKSCDICQRTIQKGKVTKVPLGDMPIMDVPFQRVGVDLVGPIFPTSDRGHRYILTLVDYATRYPEAVALKKITTEEVAEALLKIYCRVGIPEEVLSDLGTQFVSEVMKEVSRLLSIRRITTTPYNPKCNGLTEKINGVLKSMLKKLSSEKPKDWDRYVEPLLFAYREVPQDSTGFSPFELLFGRTVRGPLQILRKCWIEEQEDQEVKTSYEYVLDLKSRLEETCKVVQEQMSKAQKRYKTYYNKKARNRTYKKGDYVLILLPTDNNKLLLKWKGPFKIVECVSSCDYKLDINGKTKTFHANMLKKYFQRNDKYETQTIASIFQVASTAILEAEEWQEDEEIYCDVSLTPSQVDINPNLTSQQLNEINQIISNFQDVFSEKPGETNLIEHKIELTSDEPVKSKMYPMPYMVREEIRKEIQTMLDLKIIERSEAPYVSPVVLVRKKDGTNRFCVDYRRLNQITIFDPEPMTNPNDIYAKLKTNVYFSKIDLCKGYWQISVRETDRPKTSFWTPEDGNFQFRKMAFGLVNSAATFNRMMRKLLEGLVNVSSYIDDILIHTNTWNEHIIALTELLKRLRKANLTVKPSKCVLAYDKLEYVGHKIGSGEVGLIDENIIKIQNAPRPETKKMVKSFIGLASYYGNYIPNFSSISAPLTDLTKKGKPNIVDWQPEHEAAFTKLKQLLTSKPVLQLPDLSKMFYVQVDASGAGIGAALLQEHDGQLLPVAYASRKLLPRESLYATVEKECLAVIFAVQKFKEYLYGRTFVLQTDHQPLVCMNRNKVANDRIMRWSMILQPYSMKIEYIKGSDNLIADYLSRLCV